MTSLIFIEENTFKCINDKIDDLKGSEINETTSLFTIGSKVQLTEGKFPLDDYKDLYKYTKNLI